MASLEQSAKLDIMKLSQEYITVKVKFSRMREWTARVWLGSILLRFSLWVMPFAIEIDYPETDES